jgi:hypothetical protein
LTRNVQAGEAGLAKGHANGTADEQQMTTNGGRLVMLLMQPVECFLGGRNLGRYTDDGHNQSFCL